MKISTIIVNSVVSIFHAGAAIGLIVGFVLKAPQVPKTEAYFLGACIGIAVVVLVQKSVRVWMSDFTPPREPDERRWF